MPGTNSQCKWSIVKNWVPDNDLGNDGLLRWRYEKPNTVCNSQIQTLNCLFNLQAIANLLIGAIERRQVRAPVEQLACNLLFLKHGRSGSHV
jgi:hypothetical protein